MFSSLRRISTFSSMLCDAAPAPAASAGDDHDEPRAPLLR